MEWLDKIETMLSTTASTFTGTVILAGDTNIECKLAIKTPKTVPRNSCLTHKFPNKNTKNCILTCYRFNQLATMMHRT